MSDAIAPIREGYKLRGIPISPAGIQELILELFAGKTVERHEIVASVEKAHAERGGAASRAADFPRSVKKALANLKDLGKADNPTFGFWRIAMPDGQPTNIQISEPEVEEQEPVTVAELTLGEGSSSVYLYYYPAYRREAQSNGRSTWPCKIGRSDRDPVSRIISQAGTAMPEIPEIGLLLRTSLPSQWEHVLHGILALRGRIIDDAPGAEWFSTSPNEVAEIIRYIEPDTKPAEPAAAADGGA